MILLNQDTVNTAVFTLSELTTISNPYYLFEFISENTNVSKIFTGVDTSTNKDLYNQFSIELTSGAENLKNSIMQLPVKGYYTYNVYSMVTEGNLDINNITELVESGKVYVDDAVNPVKKSYAGGNNSKVVYNG